MRFLRFFLTGMLCAVVAGCSSAYWQSPSILTTAPPPSAPRETSRESKGGFSVLVDAPGQPTAARAVADIGAYAQRHGFVQIAATSEAGRYSSGKVTLDVFLRESDLHGIALLHCVGLSRGYAEDFYRGFNREYAPRYGEENPVIANDFEPFVRPPL